MVGLTRESLGTPKNAHSTDGSRSVLAPPRSRTEICQGNQVDYDLHWVGVECKICTLQSKGNLGTSTLHLVSLEYLGSKTKQHSYKPWMSLDFPVTLFKSHDSLLRRLRVRRPLVGRPAVRRPG